MAKKRLERIIRPSTQEERERHARIRELVMKEFPPVGGSKRAPASVNKVLKKVARSSGKTAREIAKESGVHVGVVSRFMAGELDLRVAVAEKLAKALGLSIAARSAR